MAKFKSSAKKNSRGRATPTDDSTSPADRLAASLSGSAQQVWLAGMGALGRAQAEGNRLFEGLVREGATLEKTARNIAGQRAEVVRDVVESGVGQARERATDTWDRLEKVFEDRVQRALVALGVPGREDLRDLSSRVETLTAELRRQTAAERATRAPGSASATGKAGPARARKAAPTQAPGPSAPRKAARKSTARPATARQEPAPKGAPRKAARRDTAAAGSRSGTGRADSSD